MNFLVIFIILWVSISLTERNNCSFPEGLNEFSHNSGHKGLTGIKTLRSSLIMFYLLLEVLITISLPSNK